MRGDGFFEGRPHPPSPQLMSSYNLEKANEYCPEGFATRRQLFHQVVRHRAEVARL